MRGKLFVLRKTEDIATTTILQQQQLQLCSNNSNFAKQSLETLNENFGKTNFVSFFFTQRFIDDLSYNFVFRLISK